MTSIGRSLLFCLTLGPTLLSAIPSGASPYHYRGDDNGHAVFELQPQRRAQPSTAPAHLRGLPLNQWLTPVKPADAALHKPQPGSPNTAHDAMKLHWEIEKFKVLQHGTVVYHFRIPGTRDLREFTVYPD